MTPASHHADAPPPRRARRLGLIVSIALGLSLAAGLGWAAWITRDQGRIFPGVTVEGQLVGGMTRRAAQAALQDRAAELAQAEVALRTGERDWIHSAASVGLSYDAQAAVRDAYAVGRRGWPGRRLAQRIRLLRRGVDVRLPAHLDEATARRTLRAIADQIAAGPRDATARLVEGRVEIVPQVPGGRLDLEASLAALRSWAQGDRRGPIALPAQVEAPRVSAGDLRQVNGAVAEFSTSLRGSSRNRTHNVSLAAEAMNGHVVLPGETFSYDKVVGPRTIKAGYRTAPILRHGELVPGTGGGACQVSSTLYNVALLANMKIVRRSHHSRPVPYVKPGLDATVVYGAIDFVVQNTTQCPIVIRAWVAKRRLHVQALGRLPAPRVRIVTSQRWGREDPPVEKPDPTLPEGERVVEREPQRALRVAVTRVVGEGENAVSEVIANDYYRPWPGVVLVGTAAPAPEEVEPEPVEDKEPPPSPLPPEGEKKTTENAD